VFKNILVDIDGTAAVYPAFDQAVDLARRCGARVKIVDVVEVPATARRYVQDSVVQALTDRRRDQLVQLAAAHKHLAVTCDILSGRPATALIQEVLRSGHDLLMRSHARDLATRGPRSYGAVDMELFRKCPCPVWAIVPAVRTRPIRILAAVHANPHEKGEQELNAKIIEHALQLTALEGGSLTVLQAWTAFGEEFLRNRSTAEEFEAYVEGARHVASEDLSQLTATFADRLAAARIELRKGHPEEVIPEFVVSQGIDLTVMGTVARTGIPGFLMGNTAERVLQRLLCSVLAVKPHGFESPVRL
jgi:nucleotide-binding universal stress UspA family protein